MPRENEQIWISPVRSIISTENQVNLNSTSEFFSRQSIPEIRSSKE